MGLGSVIWLYVCYTIVLLLARMIILMSKIELSSIKKMAKKKSTMTVQNK